MNNAKDTLRCAYTNEYGRCLQGPNAERHNGVPCLAGHTNQMCSHKYVAPESSTVATFADSNEVFSGKGRIEDGARRWLKRDPFFGNNRHAYCEMYVGNLCDEIERLRAVVEEGAKRAKEVFEHDQEQRKEIERLRAELARLCTCDVTIINPREGCPQHGD